MAKHRDFRILTPEPLNGQPPTRQLVEEPLTRLDRFYVRNHAPVPALDPASLRLRVEGLVERPLELSLSQLQDELEPVEREATLQCAGNRRDELMRVRELPEASEVPWGASAIGNAVWSGVPLAAVLGLAGVRAEARHVELLGADRVDKGEGPARFGGSVPLRAVRHDGALLAWAMNGEPLPPEHGAPLRAVVPGYIGARSVKWLERVVLRADPSPNHYQQRSYRLFPPHVGPRDAVWEWGLELGELSVSSVICEPEDGADLDPGPVWVRGWAMAGGDRTVERVDVSADHGATWHWADLEADRGPGVWRFWRARLELGPGAHELACRAWDSAANTQPEDPAPLWNFKGYMNNAWHRTRVWVRDPEG